jgi:hypothetical protein
LSKRRATAAEIQTEIGRRLRRAAAAQRQCAGCVAPRPVPIELRGDGVNWGVEGFQAEPGCAKFLMAVLTDVMHDFELVPGA